MLDSTKPSRAVARILGALLCLILALQGAGRVAAAEKEVPVYTFAVVPHQLPVAVYRDWSPITERLSQRLGAKVEIKIYRTIPRFEADLAQGIPDLAFMNPYHQVMVRGAGYIPLVRSSETLTGILVVPKDSPLKSVKELDGKRLAFPSPNAFGASLYMRALLTEQMKIRFNTYYVDAHNEVYRHVIRGEAAAGGGVRQTLDREPPELREQLRVLYETPPTTPHVLSAHRRVPARVRKLVLQTILQLGAGEERALLDPVQLTDPVKADYQRDYQPLQQLGLQRYVVKSH